MSRSLPLDDETQARLVVRVLDLMDALDARPVAGADVPCLQCRGGAGAAPPTHLAAPGRPEALRDVELPPGVLPFSDLECRIIEALWGQRDNDKGGWLCAEKLAALVGEKVAGDFRPVLRNLVERKAIEGSGDGFRLRRPAASP